MATFRRLRKVSYLKFAFCNDLQKFKKRFALLRSHLPPHTLISRCSGFDKAFPVLLSLSGQLQLYGSPRFWLVLRDESFLYQRFNSPVHDSPVNTDERRDLILIRCLAVAERRQDKAPCRRALGLAFQPLSYREIRSRDMGEYRVSENTVWKLFSGEQVHKTVTVSLRGLRHCCGTL